MTLHRPHVNARLMFPLSEGPSHDRRKSVAIRRFAFPPSRSPSETFPRPVRTRSQQAPVRSEQGWHSPWSAALERAQDHPLVRASCRGYDGIAVAFAILPGTPFGIRCQRLERDEPVLLRERDTRTSHLTVRPFDEFFHRPDRHTGARKAEAIAHRRRAWTSHQGKRLISPSAPNRFRRAARRPSSVSTLRQPMSGQRVVWRCLPDQHASDEGRIPRPPDVTR